MSRSAPGVYVYCARCGRHSRWPLGVEFGGSTYEWFKKTNRSQRALYVMTEADGHYAECPEHGHLGPRTRIADAIRTFWADQPAAIKVRLDPEPSDRPRFFEGLARHWGDGAQESADSSDS